MNHLGQPLLLDRVDPAVLDDDPFWSVVRRRHPEATVVLVPPAVGPPDDAGPTPDELLTVAQSLRAGWELLAPLVVAVGDDGVPSVSWRGRAEGHALVGLRVLAEETARPKPDAPEAGMRRAILRLEALTQAA